METIYEIVKIKQVYRTVENEKPLKTSSSVSVATWLQDEIGYDTQENLVVFCLDNMGKVNSYSIVHRGSLNQAIVHPRDIFQRAYLSNAARILIGHNHPSNNSNPSLEDNLFTQRLIQAGEILGIELLDHIIVGQDTYFSYRENQLIIE